MDNDAFTIKSMTIKDINFIIIQNVPNVKSYLCGHMTRALGRPHPLGIFNLSNNDEVSSKESSPNKGNQPLVIYTKKRGKVKHGKENETTLESLAFLVQF